jgi:hypothetical protein
MGKGHDPKQELPPDDMSEDRFRAVVKRLLDTPPMHKTRAVGKPPKPLPSRKATRTEPDSI